MQKGEDRVERSRRRLQPRVPDPCRTQDRGGHRERRHVADGRAKDNAGSDPTLLETALAAQQLGLKDALNLDGGSSTTVVVAGQTLMNGRGSAPRVHNGLGFVPLLEQLHTGFGERIQLDGRQSAMTPAAAAELGRQAAVAGTPGSDASRSAPGRLRRSRHPIRPGHLSGVAIARADGVTLHAPKTQLNLLAGTLPGLPR